MGKGDRGSVQRERYERRKRKATCWHSDTLEEPSAALLMAPWHHTSSTRRPDHKPRTISGRPKPCGSCLGQPPRGYHDLSQGVSPVHSANKLFSSSCETCPFPAVCSLWLQGDSCPACSLPFLKSDLPPLYTQYLSSGPSPTSVPLGQELLSGPRAAGAGSSPPGSAGL